MKKSIFTFCLAAIFSIGLMTSCTKDNDVKPVIEKSEVYEQAVIDAMSEPKKKRKKR